MQMLQSGDYRSVRTKQLKGPIRELIVGDHRLTYFIYRSNTVFRPRIQKKEQEDAASGDRIRRESLQRCKEDGMKKKQKKTWKSIPFKKEDMKWYTLEEVFKKVDEKQRNSDANMPAASQRLELAKQLRDVATAKRMTQKNVADKASMPQSVIARLESGEHSASIATLGKVASALGKQIALIDAT